jgi:hypothetical protein
VLLTYLLPGLLAIKFSVVRAGFPLPAERIAEHHRWADEHRRHTLWLLGNTGWFLVAVLAAYALLNGWAPAKALPWFRWMLVTLVAGVWLVMRAIHSRRDRRLAGMGRDLRPLVSSTAAIPRLAWLQDAGPWYTLAYVSGSVLLLLFFRRW